MDKQDIIYTITGTIVHGANLGTKMGIPTVNLSPKEGDMTPEFGVYVSEVIIDGEVYRGVTNIGIKPTVTDAGNITVETNILDYNKEVYGHEITVHFLKFLRPEKKFASIDALVAQINLDIQSAREYENLK